MGDVVRLVPRRDIGKRTLERVGMTLRETIITRTVAGIGADGEKMPEYGRKEEDGKVLRFG